MTDSISRCELFNKLATIPAPPEANDFKAEVYKVIQQMETTDKWIPCSERLPKIGEYHISEPCLVYCKGGVYAFAELEENIFGQVGWNCERDDDYHEPIGEVVAWMPLPKPWKGADDEL